MNMKTMVSTLTKIKPAITLVAMRRSVPRARRYTTATTARTRNGTACSRVLSPVKRPLTMSGGRMRASPAVRATADQLDGPKGKQHQQGGQRGGVEEGAGTGWGQRGVRQERAEDGDEHDDGRRQQGEQPATANPLQAPDGAAAGHRQGGRNRHR